MRIAFGGNANWKSRAAVVRDYNRTKGKILRTLYHKRKEGKKHRGYCKNYYEKTRHTKKQEKQKEEE